MASDDTSNAKRVDLRLSGIMTGFDWFGFREDIQAGTGSWINWSNTGEPGEPWPPDVWIEGNNGHGAMRVNYKGDRRFFDYEDFRVNDRQIDGTALANRVIEHLEACGHAEIRAFAEELQRKREDRP
ncbi:hypothetical protein [Glycomyces paridis]|uniref:Uncharacterized protein n=1 Tax=Glycomyces paridis TaxID=2126555 RepID=A0A4S8PHH8_9ACTN|nr:hypothetical protein [Glycomyces paridis]THV30040.1 hypothetical protein E9998_06580 [Glycomyces paridis]